MRLGFWHQINDIILNVLAAVKWLTIEGIERHISFLILNEPGSSVVILRSQSCRISLTCDFNLDSIKLTLDVSLKCHLNSESNFFFILSRLKVKCWARLLTAYRECHIIGHDINYGILLYLTERGEHGWGLNCIKRLPWITNRHVNISCEICMWRENNYIFKTTDVKSEFGWKLSYYLHSAYIHIKIYFMVLVNVIRLELPIVCLDICQGKLWYKICPWGKII